MTAAETEVVVQLAGQHQPGTGERAEQRVRSAIQHARGPIPRARVRIARHPDPVAHPRVTAAATVDADGHLIHVRVRAETDAEAVDRLRDRLRARLEHDRHNAGWEDRRGTRRSSDAREWRDTQLAQPRLTTNSRPPEQRNIVRHTTFTPGAVDLDEAADDLALLDHDFHLFTECGTGQEAALYRTATGLRLALIDPQSDALALHSAPVELSPQPAPVLDVVEARERLELLALPFLFFLDAERGRGAIFYHRRDGHYGLVTPLYQCT